MNTFLDKSSKTVRHSANDGLSSGNCPQHLTINFAYAPIVSFCFGLYLCSSSFINITNDNQNQKDKYNKIKQNRDWWSFPSTDRPHHLRIVQAIVRNFSTPHFPQHNPKAEHIKLIINFLICVSFRRCVLWCSFVQNCRLRMPCNLRQSKVSNQKSITSCRLIQLSHHNYHCIQMEQNREKRIENKE